VLLGVLYYTRIQLYIASNLFDSIVSDKNEPCVPLHMQKFGFVMRQPQ
jgi:hypothetical protein